MIPADRLSSVYGKEMALIILCFRVHFKTAGAVELTNYLAANTISWPEVQKRCSLHKIRPVVYGVLLSARIPEEIKTALKETSLTLTARNWKLAIETTRIIHLLKKNNIACTAYKGAAFSAQFYGDLVSRESDDIDLSIHPNDLWRVISILEEAGYRSEQKDLLDYLGPAYFSYYKDHSFNLFSKGKRIFHVEFHWGIADRCFNVPQQANTLLTRTQEELVMAHEKIPAPCKTDHFLAIFIHHAVKDTFRQLKNIADLSQCFLEHREIDWEKVIPMVKDLRLQKRFSLALSLSATLFGVAPPAVDDPKMANTALTRRFLTQLCSGKIIRTNAADRHFLHNQVVLADSGPAKLRFLARYAHYLASPGELDFRTFFLPGPLFALYPLLKPFRFLFKRYDPVQQKKNLIPPG